MRTYSNRPAKSVVLKIAAKVARKHGFPPDRLFVGLYERRLVRARAEALVKILEETHCSAGGLADVWGCDRTTVVRAAREAERKIPKRPKMDAVRALNQHKAAVEFLYPDRAKAILSGNDPKTQADLASWRSLGVRVAA